MKILLSAYACEPDKGSEQGVGWNWAIELARLGHAVVVLTRSNNRIGIENAFANAPIAGIEFEYYDLPAWAKRWKKGPRGLHLYYLLWQWGACRYARGLVRARASDVVHHVTFGGFRQPSFMGGLGLPFIVGPIGGGESSPRLLRSGLSPRHQWVERLREFSNRAARWDPWLRTMTRRATLIFCKTAETRALLPAGCQAKCQMHSEIGMAPSQIREDVSMNARDGDFLFAGRLVYWKGVHLALQAFAQVALRQPSATLTIMGDGPEQARLRALAAALGIADSVRWLGWVPHQQMQAHYNRYAAFVFPSMHDSSGNVVLEAMSQGVPVICLDTGGPGEILPANCGMKVPVEGQSETEVIMQLAAAMRRLSENPGLRAQMGWRALEAARAHSWSVVVASAYQAVEEAMLARGGLRRPVAEQSEQECIAIPKSS